MIKPIYTIPETAPMKFYRFLVSFALPVGFFVNLGQFFSNISSISSSRFYLIDAFFTLVHAILLVLIWVRMSDMEWLGVRFLYADMFWIIGYQFVVIIISLSISASSIPTNSVSTVVAYSIILLLYWIYFSKRRLLFSPVPSYGEYYSYQKGDEVAPLNEEPSPVEDAPIQNSSTEPIALPSRELDTSPTLPSSKRLVSFSVPIFVFLISVLCISAGAIGYICYSTGYNAGNGAGYEIGHETGYDEGHSEGYTDAKSKYSKTIADLRKEKNELKDEVADLQERADTFQDLFFETSDEWLFFHNYAVIVTTTGSKYHHYGCPHLDGRRYYIYNIENAEYQGYTPCLDCWDE